jgi:hypothetical protein
VDNYFNYFTEIEDHFQQRRGSILLLSTLDWALIETWRDAGIPLEAVLRGIDTAFDRHDARRRPTSRRVNGLAWCAQEVMTAAEELQEASLGVVKPQPDAARAGFEWRRIAAHLQAAAAQLRAARLSGLAGQTARESADRLEVLAAPGGEAGTDLEGLERTLTVLEEKLRNALLATIPEQDLKDIRGESEREVAPYRRRMQALQIRQLEQQFVHKRLLEKYNLPRFSLFYMRQDQEPA